MRLFVDYVATKKVMASALGSIVDAMVLLVDRARAVGDIRPDVDPNDLLRALVGFTYGAANPGWQASALRLIDILMDGLRPPRTVG